MDADHRLKNTASWFGIAAIGWCLLITAWISDDAYITARHIDNFLNGDGLRFNVVERVQAYTHPLWMALNVPALALYREPAIAMLITSFAVLAAAGWVIARKVATTMLAGIAFLVLALMSRSIADFSTSGLETPLTLLVIALAVWKTSDTEPFNGRQLGLLAAAAWLTRPDLILLVWPLLALSFWKKRSFSGLWTGIAVLAVWMGFSLVYYGSLVPNTAIAKLPPGMPRGWFVEHGLQYLIHSLQHDPLIGLIILAGVVTSLRYREYPATIGIVAYLAYTVSVGGDFMAGRFFFPPAILSICIMAKRLEIHHRAAVAILLAAPLLVFLSWSRVAEPSNEVIPPHGIVDERRFYGPDASLVKTVADIYHHGERQSALKTEARHYIQAAQKSPTGRLIVTTAQIGSVGFYAGRNVHVLDWVGLSDAFIARLPASPESRIGHFEHLVPPEYVRRVTSSPVVFDQRLAPLLNDVVLVTRGEIWTAKRFAAIWRLNLR